MYVFFGRHLTTPWGSRPPTLGTTAVQSADIKAAQRSRGCSWTRSCMSQLHFTAGQTQLCFTEVTLYFSLQHLLISALITADFSRYLLFSVDRGALSLSSAVNVLHHIRHYDTLCEEFLSQTNGLTVKLVCNFLTLEVGDTDRLQHRDSNL